MKAAPFAYVKPASLLETFDALDRYAEDAKILAGGQSLMPALNLRLSAPAVLVDINALDLAGVSVVRDRLRIGALARHRVLERSPLVARHAPLMAQAMPHVAHAAVRNRGTFGGSLAFADPAAELPAVCVALDAELTIASRTGERQMRARDFFRGLYEVALGPGEVLVAADFPQPAPGVRCAFLELARRHGDYAIVGLAAQVRYDGVYSEASVAFFGIGDKPVLALGLCRAIEGRAYSAALVSAAQAALGGDLTPDDDLYQRAQTKTHLAKVLAARALAALAGVTEPARG